jgi:hypothetical protein
MTHQQEATVGQVIARGLIEALIELLAWIGGRQ